MNLVVLEDDDIVLLGKQIYEVQEVQAWPFSRDYTSDLILSVCGIAIPQTDRDSWTNSGEQL